MRHGPQPYAGYLSDVCSLFGCTPAEAEEQDPLLVRQIAEYRVARQAVELFNDPQRHEELHASPAHMELYAAMLRAQAATLDG